MIRNQNQTQRLTFDGVSDHVTLWLELKRAYAELRGADAGPNRKLVPRTTNADVMQLAERWTEELRKTHGKGHYDRARTRWQACLDEVAGNARGKDPDAAYAENPRFWQEHTRRLAVHLESVKGLPSRWDLAVQSVKESFAELPQRIGDAGRGTRDAARAAARGAGSLLDFLAKPLVIAGLVLGGAVILPPLLGRR